jgi:hypothetical protein
MPSSQYGWTGRPFNGVLDASPGRLAFGSAEGRRDAEDNVDIYVLKS